MTPLTLCVLLAGGPASLASASGAGWRGGHSDERASGEASFDMLHGMVRAVVDPLTAAVYQVPAPIFHVEQASPPNGRVQLRGSMALATAPLQAAVAWKLLEKADVVGQAQRLMSHRPKFKGKSTDGSGMVKTPFLGFWAFCAMALTTAAAWRKISQLRAHTPKCSRSSRRVVTLLLPEDIDERDIREDIETGTQQKSATPGQNRSPRTEWLMQDDQRQSVHEEEVLAATTPKTRGGRASASFRDFKRHMTPSSSWFFSQYQAAPVTCEQHTLADGSAAPSEAGSDDDDDSDAGNAIQEHEDEIVLSPRSSLFRIRSSNQLQKTKTSSMVDDGLKSERMPSKGRQPRVRIGSASLGDVQ